ASNGIHTAFIGAANGVLMGAKTLYKVLGKDTDLIDGAMDSLRESATKNGEDIIDAWNDMQENGEKFNHAMEQIFNPTDYKPVTVQQMTQAMGGLSDGLEETGGSAEDAAKKVEDFQSK